LTPGSFLWTPPVARGDAIEFDAVAMRRLMEDNDVLGRELTARFMRSVLDRLRAARVHLHGLYQDRPVQPSE
jgi:CRP/FNR family transcriptional regulator, cyclic AMP receptor protein